MTNESWHHDPDDFLGMAHFVEHMLFLGSTKFHEHDPYPGHSYYEDFLNTNGGFSNAYTGSENTGYYYWITTNHFLEALDIFAHTLISPIFNETFIKREVAAVNSEYMLGVQDDANRFSRVFASLTDHRHPFHRFSVGSTETLLSGDRQKKLRQKTVEFFRTRYSSDLMNLVVVDKRSLDDLQLKVAPLFSQIRRVPNASASAKIEGYPFATKSFLGKKIAIQSLIQASELAINFHIPSHYSVFEEKKAFDYVQSFFIDTSKNTCTI
uniref:Peptidase M16 N-terminal domain-containing protein n=1 Tax=Romanomermis culicivorax TaxID=13658 RepID=A0A915ICN8_ROMCU